MGDKKAERIKALEDQVQVLAWLHAERDYHLLNAFTVVTNAINMLAWLYSERSYQLEVFIESEERLMRRARALKAVKTQAERSAAGLPIPTVGKNNS